MATGILFQRRSTTISQLRDGASNTYLIGVKRRVTDGYDWGDDQHMFLGHGLDTARYTSTDLPPARDGITPGHRQFGSAHASGGYFVFADGAVHRTGYDVDPETHRRLGNRHDRLPVDIP